MGSSRIAPSTERSATTLAGKPWMESVSANAIRDFDHTQWRAAADGDFRDPRYSQSRLWKSCESGQIEEASDDAAAAGGHPGDVCVVERDARRQARLPFARQRAVDL